MNFFFNFGRGCGPRPTATVAAKVAEWVGGLDRWLGWANGQLRCPSKVEAAAAGVQRGSTPPPLRWACRCAAPHTQSFTLHSHSHSLLRCICTFHLHSHSHSQPSLPSPLLASLATQGHGEASVEATHFKFVPVKGWLPGWVVTGLRSYHSGRWQQQLEDGAGPHPRHCAYHLCVLLLLYTGTRRSFG